MKIHLKKVSALFMVLVLAASLAGCGSKADAAGAATTEKGTDSQKVQKIIVGTGNAFKPYCYLDENGKLAGYEYEVLKQVDALLPQYKFEYQTMDFSNILVSLDSGKIDLAAHQFEENDERKQKYLFGTESYTTFVLRITVKKGRTDIKSIDDLQGKKVQVGTGGNDAYILEQYNKEHADKPINLVYASPTSEQQVNNIDNGTYDAVISVTRIVNALNKEYGDKLQTVGDPIYKSNTYYLYAKDNTKLQTAVDGALKKLKDSGKLAEISKKVLGGDYTTAD